MSVSVSVSSRWWPRCTFLMSAGAMAMLQLVWAPSSFLDLTVYRAGAGLVLHGHPLYAASFAHRLGFTYPPFTALLFTVLRAGSMRDDAIAVTVLNLGLVAVLAHCAMRFAAGPADATQRARRSGPAWLAAALGVWMLPVTSAIGSGQIDVLIAVLVIVDLTWGTDSCWGGALIGLAAALKLTPLVFVAYLAFAGRPRMAARAVAMVGLSVALAWAIAPGDARAYWTGGLFDTGHVTGTRTGGGRGPADQSLHGALLRLAPSLSHHPGIWMAICGLVAVTGLALAVGAARRGDRVSGYLVTAVTGLLVCPVTWVHHGVIAVPGLLWVLLKPRRSTRARALIALAVAAASWALKPVIAADPTGAHLGALQTLVADSYVIAGVAILIAAAVTLAGAHWPSSTRVPRLLEIVRPVPVAEA